MSDESVTPAAVPACQDEMELRYCRCADPENCTETIHGYVCRKGSQRAAAAPPPLDLKDWRIIRERTWDYHDEYVVVRPFVDALLAEIERLRSLHAAPEGARRFQSCQCPATSGEDCPLTVDECHARTADFVGLPWFGARLRRVWDGFVRESLNGVVCSIPDSGLDTPPHRTWCVRCQNRYMELFALVNMLDPGHDDRRLAADSAAPSKPVVAEGALRALVEQWQSDARTAHDDPRANALDDCASELAALLPARPASVKET